MWFFKSITLLLAIFSPAKPTALNQYKPLSTPYKFNKSMVYYYDISNIFLKARKENTAVLFSYVCYESTTVSFEKCNQTFLHTDPEMTSNTVIFQDEWIDYMLDISYHPPPCPEGNGRIGLRLKLTTNYESLCLMTFRMGDKIEYIESAEPSLKFHVNQMFTWTKSYETQLPLATLPWYRERQLNLISKINTMFNVTPKYRIVISKCGMIDEELSRDLNGTRVSFSEDQIDRFIRISHLFCFEDDSTSFNTTVITETPIYGHMYYQIPDVMNRTYVRLLSLLLLWVAGILYLVIIMKFGYDYHGLFQVEYMINNGNNTEGQRVIQHVEVIMTV